MDARIAGEGEGSGAGAGSGDGKTIAPDRPRREKLLGIQAARGAAALLVVVYHAGRMIALPQYAGYTPLGEVFGFGHAGVDFFFVLSGFIIYFVHRSDIGRPSRLGVYVWRRLTRIYPIYWVVTALVLAIALASHGAAGWPDPAYLVNSVLLLPQDVDPLLGVAWTLEHEMLFYAVFALAVANRRLGLFVFTAWLAGIVATIVVPGMLAPPAPGSPSIESWSDFACRFIAGSVHLQFFMGIAAAHVVLTHTARDRLRPSGDRPPRAWAPGCLAACGAAAFLAAGWAENAGLFERAGLASEMLFGAASVCVVIGLALAESRGLFSAGPIAALFGAASYALYLIHTVVMGLVFHAMAAAGLMPRIPGWAAMTLAIAMAVASGAILHLMIERPLTARIGRLRLSPRGMPTLSR